MRSLTKGLLLGAIGSAAAITFYAHYIERAGVRLDRFTVPMDKPGIPPQGLTSCICPIYICGKRNDSNAQARQLAPGAGLRRIRPVGPDR